MEKQIKFSNVVFKLYFKDQDKYKNTTYHFKICDRATKAKAIQVCDDVKVYKKTNKANVDHNFNNCVYDYHAGSDKHASKYAFKVKEKWLDTSNDFIEGVYFQGDLDLLFYSMDRPDLSRNSGFCSRIETEGYYAKLSNVKQVEIEK